MCAPNQRDSWCFFVADLTPFSITGARPGSLASR
jgi:hypothetical protein